MHAGHHNIVTPVFLLSPTFDYRKHIRDLYRVDPDAKDFDFWNMFDWTSPGF
jgi:hypothetical protein